MRFTYVNYSSSSFFNFIRNTFGLYTVFLLKKWIHNNKDLVKIKARNKYLLHCKRSNLVPKHLIKHVAHNLRFYNDYSTRHATIYSLRFIRLILNLEISDNFKRLKSLTVDTYRLSRAIENNLPVQVCNQFFSTQHMSLLKLVDKEKIRFNKKLVWCSYNNSFTDRNINKIKNIKYICEGGRSNSQMDRTIVLHGSNTPTIERSNNIFSVYLDPLKYADTPGMLLEPREKWFVNISNTVIPNDVIGLLQLGEGFCLPPDNKMNLLIEYIKHIENSFMRLKQRHSCINTIRSHLSIF